MNPVTFQILGVNSGFVDLNFNVSWNNLTPETQGLKNISITIDGFINSNGTNSLIAEVTVNQTSNSFRSRYNVRVISKNVGFNNGSVNFVVEKVDTKLFLSISTISVTHNPKAYNPNLRKALGNPNMTGSLSHFNINGGLIANSVREPDNLQIINIAHYTFNTIKIKELPKVINIGLEYESFVEEIDNNFDINHDILYLLFQNEIIKNNQYIGASIVYPLISDNMNNLYVNSYSQFPGFVNVNYDKPIEIWFNSASDDVDYLKNELNNLFSYQIPVDIKSITKFKILKNNIPSNVIIKITNQSGSEIYWDSSKNTSKNAFILSSDADLDFDGNYHNNNEYDFIRHTGTLETSLFFRLYKADGTLFKKFTLKPINEYQEFSFPTIGYNFDLQNELLNYIKYGY